MNTIKSLAVCLALAAGVSAESTIADFMKYCSEHNKSYSSMEEFKMRFEFFKKAEVKIQEHSQKNDVGYQLGHTQFSDWSDKEFNGILGTRKVSRERRPVYHAGAATIPTSWDWRNHNAVTPVKN